MENTNAMTQNPPSTITWTDAMKMIINERKEEEAIMMQKLDATTEKSHVVIAEQEALFKRLTVLKKEVNALLVKGKTVGAEMTFRTKKLEDFLRRTEAMIKIRDALWEDLKNQDVTNDGRAVTTQQSSSESDKLSTTEPVASQDSSPIQQNKNLHFWHHLIVHQPGVSKVLKKFRICKSRTCKQSKRLRDLFI
jgi:hypothetical protein